MKIKYIFLGMLLCGVSAQARIIDESVERDFAKREKSIAGVGSAKVFKQKLTADQRDALKFLFAYMPFCDVTDRTAEFYLQNVDCSLQARREMPWGSKVSDLDFRHFVLPIRVNDESIDLHRPAFYAELKDRVKGLSMKDAILEVNHWCHEKATYQPSDGRTHAPLATVYTGIGRCGEESVFTVAALRSVGIPARQVYTPRWAHTDDNHAWVEAWADGQWYFLGACEPEPILNLGWFNAPASRGMLMNSRTFGRYAGPEEKLLSRDFYTDINVTQNYAPVETLNVKVVDEKGNIVPNAQVSFRLYNYSEFYPIAKKESDAKGEASLVAGLGDLLVWASKDGVYGYTKATVGKDREVTVTIGGDKKGNNRELDIVPPALGKNLATASEAQAAANSCRLVSEDSIRGAYLATFCTEADAAALADELGLDKEEIKRYMKDARGNHKVIASFLRSQKVSDRQRALDLLYSLTPKDLSDVPAEVLNDCMTMPVYDTPLYGDYILSPRIWQEPLTPYVSYFRKAIPAKKREAYRKDPRSWIKWVSENISTKEEWYPTKTRMTPRSVYEYRRTTPESRNIFFVASARAMGIPVRIDVVTDKTQWADANGEWHDADFEAPVAVETPKVGKVQLDYTLTGRIDDPKYYSNFTLSKIVDGEPQLQNYPEDGVWSKLFREPADVDAGEYMLVSGQRLADGSVLSAIRFFEVEPGKLTRVPLEIRQDASELQVIGNFDSESRYFDQKAGAEKSVLSTTGRGYYVLGILKPLDEPTNHALRDIGAVAKEFEDAGMKMVLLYADAENLSKADAEIINKLPKTASLGTDIDGKITKAVTEALKLSETERPIFIVADTFNRVVFVSQGYTIGLGERLVDTLHKVSNK